MRRSFRKVNKRAPVSTVVTNPMLPKQNRSTQRSICLYTMLCNVNRLDRLELTFS